MNIFAICVSGDFCYIVAEDGEALQKLHSIMLFVDSWHQIWSKAPLQLMSAALVKF